ncbi:MAG TPA: pseudouridine synthase, partial [Ohtaekwangia sp.]|uniref:pseudouridine synthase n=1 Tax=Ohtaekwangia sp. TaxID=2066019 RepID=UPI002F95B576
DFDKPEGRSFRKRISEDGESDSRGFASKRKTTGGRKSFDATATEAPAQTEKIRLNRYIANSGVCSRREADELIGMGLISVNGKTITELGYKVNPGDEVRYESKVLRAEKPVYVLLNKPKGYLTTTADPQERNTVMHLLGNHIKERIYPVGRLDRNTTGLLLLTNDGDLADKLMHPSYNVKKIYKVELDRPLTKADFQKISEGIHLEEGKAMVDDLAIISDDNKTVGVELHIGWNRVVRRIFESLEYQVVKLDRSVYAGLDKKDLGRGEWRFLKKEEIIRLKNYR